MIFIKSNIRGKMVEGLFLKWTLLFIIIDFCRFIFKGSIQFEIEIIRGTTDLEGLLCYGSKKPKDGFNMQI